MANNDLISRTELLKEITLAEAASRTAYPKTNFTKRDMVSLIKNAKAKEAKPQKGCDWCQPNDDGEYSMLAFQNPTNPAQQATESFYNGTFAVELKLDNATKPARISAEMKFCPFCGRRFESEGTV